MAGFAPLARAPLASLPLPLADEGTALLRWANRGYISAPTDAPASAWHEPRVLGEVELAASIADALGLGGRAALGVGEILLANHDHALDDLIRWGRADGRRITLRVGEVADARASDAGAPLAACRRVLVGRTARFVAWGTTARLALADALEAIGGPLQPVVYAGTGGMEGQAELAGQPKPVTFGQVFNIAPVFLGNVDLGDGALPTYQSHWRAIDGHTAVRERGVEMVEVGSAPGIGEWRDWPSAGAFQIGFSPAGAITADLRGDAVGFWAATLPEIVARLLTSLSPSLTPGDLDARSFDRAAIDLPGTIGWHRAQPIDALAALEAICAGALAHLWATREGRIGLSALSPPAAAPDLVLDRPDIIAAEPTPAPASFWPLPAAIEVEHGRTWEVLTDLAGSVPEGLRARLSAASQVARVVSSTAALFTGRTRALRLPALYASGADALARATAVRALVDRLPTRLRVVTDRYRGQVEIGHTARVWRDDIAGGWWSGVVVGWRERLAAQRVELDLWG